MATERRAFVVGVRAGDLRRSLGPTAWAVLEELVAQSTGPAERCEVTATTRTLAVELGLSKDTVAHALLRLHQAGRAVTDSGLLSRRAARRDLTDATDNLATVETALEALTRRAAPILDRRDQLREERDRLRRHATTNRRLLRLLDDHETAVAVAQETVDALGSWKCWATGRKISPEQLVDTVEVLRHTHRADHTALAAPLATWMDQHHLAPQRPSVEFAAPRLERPGLEIGF